MSLTTFIDEVITEIETLGTMRQVSKAPGDLKKWPAAPVYSVSGQVYGEMGNVARYRHNVRIGILGPYDGDTQKITAALLPLLESLVEALITKMLADGFTTVDHFDRIDYVFGPVNWAGKTHFGFLLDIYDVTVRRVMT